MRTVLAVLAIVLLAGCASPMAPVAPKPAAKSFTAAYCATLPLEMIPPECEGMV
jgi:uncharacterized protein YceK